MRKQNLFIILLFILLIYFFGFYNQTLISGWSGLDARERAYNEKAKLEFLGDYQNLGVRCLYQNNVIISCELHGDDKQLQSIANNNIGDVLKAIDEQDARYVSDRGIDDLAVDIGSSVLPSANPRKKPLCENTAVGRLKERLGLCVQGVIVDTSEQIFEEATGKPAYIINDQGDKIPNPDVTISDTLKAINDAGLDVSSDSNSDSDSDSNSASDSNYNLYRTIGIIILVLIGLLLLFLLYRNRRRLFK